MGMSRRRLLLYKHRQQKSHYSNRRVNQSRLFKINTPLGNVYKIIVGLYTSLLARTHPPIHERRGLGPAHLRPRGREGDAATKNSFVPFPAPSATCALSITTTLFLTSRDFDFRFIVLFFDRSRIG
ncbi:hypothetical protein J6590_002229 [Homalodisca vitripennis]|nr:hypothetical protein J6590_002229 [Homalodisca vitripennis]